MNLFKAKIIFIVLAALTCINVAGFFIFNQIVEIASAGQIRTVDFPTISNVSRSGYSFDDIYRLTVPSSYHGCYVNVVPYASGDDCSTYCRVSITAKNCDNQSSCLIGVSPSETIDMAFAPNDDCYGCYWGFYLYIYGWCGDGSCKYYTDDRSCVNNQLVPENCTNCPQDCATPAGSVCCNGVKYGGDCCADSGCSSGMACVSHKCASSSYCGDGACDSGETCASCPSDCGACQTAKPSSLSFSAAGGTLDGGAVTASEGGYTWTVAIPDNFTKVETAHYDKNNSSVIKKYMGWNGYLKINGVKVWEFKNWSSATGGQIYDAALGQTVNESSGSGLWLDATKFFKAGSNTVTFYHYNEGDGIGLKIKVVVGSAKQADGSSCLSASECRGNYCVHGKCRSSSTYCGDGQCDDSETCGCSDCSSQSRCEEQNKEEAGRQEAGKPAVQEARQAPAGSAEEERQQQAQLAVEAEKSPDLKLSFSSQTIALKVGEEKDLTVIFNNKGEGAAGNVYYSINVDKPEIAELSGLEKVIGDMAPAREAKENIKIKAKKSGAAYLMFHVRGDNFGSIAKFIRVDIEDALALDAPESIYLLPGESREFGVFIINQSSQIASVKLLTMTSSNPAVVSVEAGSVLEIKGGEQGIKPDRLFSTESEDILNSIVPRPKIKAVSEGDGELVFKLAYFIGGKEKIFEKKTKVKVGKNSSGQRAELKLEIVPPSLAVERGEAREVKLILKNTGSTIIKQGAIIIDKPVSAPFEVTGEVAIKDYIEPGEEAVAKIEVIGHPQLSIAQEELAKKGELAVSDSITFSGQYATIDNRRFDFKNEMKISWVEERRKCDFQDSECVKAVDCLISLSNSMGCATEFADIIPYLDKPVAAVLATSDACEIKGRLDSGDNIGAAISAILMASDMGDNAGEAVPGAGNLASAFIDTIEGAADCTEGFVHDAVDEYCAGGEGKGYSGCADKIINAMAIETGRWKDPRAAKRYVVAVVGSPVTIAVVDDSGKELTPADGVLTMQKEELKMAFIKNPDKLTNGYNFKITGFDDGEYNLHLALVDNGLIMEKEEIINQPIEADKTVEIPMVVKTEENNRLSLLVGEEVDKSKEKKKTNNYALLIIVAIAAMAGAGLIVYRRKIGGIKIKGK